MFAAGASGYDGLGFPTKSFPHRLPFRNNSTVELTTIA
jgi:hypothetical protein